MAFGKGIDKYAGNLINSFGDIWNFSHMFVFFIFSFIPLYYNYDSDMRYRVTQIAKNRFKKVMDNSSERIVVIKDEKIVYVND